MTTIKEITTMCKAGSVQDAYQLAKADFAIRPTDIWVQREVGWALYYMIKGDSEKGDYNKLLNDIDELKALNQLTITNDGMIFSNVLFQIASFIQNHIPSTDINASAKLSGLFSKLKDYSFNSSLNHYSYLLQVIIKFKDWLEMADFFDWWNLDNLTPEDYNPYINQKGQKMMTLAERAYIANSKALLKLKDSSKIELFLPKLENLMKQHPEMMYPGYFYGKLLLSLGNNTDEALKVLITFARKKSSEFWVWQLLSDVFFSDEKKQLACLLRAVHCPHTQESFLGKVRIKLATLYIKMKQFNLARYQIDSVVRCYVSQGWRLPYEIECWTHQPWIHTTTPDNSDPIDYKNITEEILCNGAEECIAVVTYVDQNSHKSVMIYGYKQRCAQKLRLKTVAGNILRLHYIIDVNKNVKVINARKEELSTDLSYAKCVEGIIDKRNDKEFAFLKVGNDRCFVSPTLVKKNDLKNGDSVKSLIVFDFDKKKSSWNWVCVNIKK